MASLRTERCAACRHLFNICRGCDSGQIYCGTVCSGAARTTSLRGIRARYQHTPQGLERHRQCQSNYRQRERERVTDQASPQEVVCPTVAEPTPIPLAEGVAEVTCDAITMGSVSETPAADEAAGANSAATGVVVACSFCGRRLAFVRRTFLRRTDRWRPG